MARILHSLSIVLLIVATCRAEETTFKVGFAKRDITPQAPTPMWGYGARHAMLSQGTAAPLLAKAVVIEVGDERLAIVGMDLGRGPTTAMMEEIRKSVSQTAGVDHVMIGGRFVTATNRTFSLPEPLKCWCQVLTGIANIAPACHSNVTFCPASFQTLVDPRPLRMRTISS